MSGESRSVVVRLSMDTAQAIAATAAFGTEMTAAMARAEKSAMSASRAVDTIGSSAGKAALVAGGALAFMTKAAMDWESEWVGVAKTVNGTSSQLDQLEGDLRGLARTMPATHQEIAAVAEAAGQLGVATTDITEFTRVMVMMGASTNLSADDAATAIAQFMNVMQTVPGEVDNIANTIVDLGNKGASTESQITEMAQRLAGAGALVGASESDVLGLASAMANLGIQSELGGGAMQRIFVGINTAVRSGSDVVQQYATVAGTSADEFSRAWRTSPVQALDQLLQGLGDIQDQGGDVASVLESMGIKGTQNLQVMLRLAGAGDVLTASLEDSSQAWQQNSALTQEYGKRAETTAAQAQVAWNNIKDAAIDAGASALPVVADISQDVASVARAFGELPDPVQSSVTKLLALSAIAGGGIWAGTKVYGFVTSTREALDALTYSSDRSGLSLGRLAGAAGRISLLAGAVSALGNVVADLSGAKLNVSDLQRDLEAVAQGRASAVLDRIVSDLENLDYISNKATEPLYELSTGFGLLGNTPMDNAASNIEQVDQALASLVESGHADQASQIFAQIQSALTGAPVGSSFAPVGDAAKGFDAYATALDNASHSADDSASASTGLAGATSAAGDAAGGAAINIGQMVSAMQRERDAALGAFDAETQYRQALKAAQAQAAKNNAGIRGNSDAVLANRQALSTLAAAWNGQSKAVKNNVDRFREARSTFIATAIAMGVPEDRARSLAKAVLDIPRSRVIDVHAETGQAMSAMDQVAARLRDMNGRTATTYVRTVYQHLNKLPDVMGNAAPGTNALGGFYPAAYATGGIDRANAHQADITRGGPIRIWSEPETGGEAYIPLANDGRRPRARQILSQTAYALGGEVSWRRGTTVRSGGSSQGGPLPIQGRIVLDADGRGGTLVGLISGVARSEIAADHDYEQFKRRR